MSAVHRPTKSDLDLPLAMVPESPRFQRRGCLPMRSRSTRILYIFLPLMMLLIFFEFSRLRDISTSLLGLKKPPPPQRPPPWMSFSFLHRYYGGVRSVSTDSTPEYPYSDAQPQKPVRVEMYPNRSDTSQLPRPRLDDPYPDYYSSIYEQSIGHVEPCFLDEKETMPVPRPYVFDGSVQGFSRPMMGSYSVVGINGNKCYDRFGRYGAYGYGYSQAQGGIGAGLDGDREGVDLMYSPNNHTDYRKVQWGEAQKRCLQKNRHRFPLRTNHVDDKYRAFPPEHVDQLAGSSAPPAKKPIARTAVMLRTWHTYQWTQETILHMRAMIAELSLLSGGEYQVYFLVHVKDTTLPIWSSDEVYNKVLEDALPEEFRGMGVLWSEKQMEMNYYGLQENYVMGHYIFGVFRSAHFPLQWFAHEHPEYEFFWNWEIDIRYTGHWYELFDSLGAFARNEPRKGLWERSERFYVPSVHGTWEQFRDSVTAITEKPPPQPLDKVGVTQLRAEPPVWGRKAPVDGPFFPNDPKPPHAYEDDKYEWGIGEEADLITLNPLFNPAHSGWVFSNDITGYNLEYGRPPRRTSIITASRLSRRLLNAMHAETALFRHTMFDEMWPATVALHHGLKAAYAPHPVFVDRAWPPSYLEKTFNPGVNRASGSAAASPFNILHEHNFRGVSWYFNAGFPSNIYRRWLGFRVDNTGGFEEEMAGEGRMCLPPMLLHPIKQLEFPVIQELEKAKANAKKQQAQKQQQKQQA